MPGKQQPDCVRHIRAGGFRKRRREVVRFQIRIRVVLEQHFGDIGIVPAGGHDQRSVPGRVETEPGVWIGATIQEELDHIGVPACDRPVQGRGTVRTLRPRGAHIRACIDQLGGHDRLVVYGGQIQRRQAMRISQVDVGMVPDEQLDHGIVPVNHGEMERGAGVIEGW